MFHGNSPTVHHYNKLGQGQCNPGILINYIIPLIKKILIKARKRSLGIYVMLCMYMV